MTLTAAGTDTIAAITAQATAAAEANNLRIVPARLDCDNVVALDEHSLTVEDAVAMAAHSGASPLYLHATQIDTDALRAASGEIDLP